MEIPRTKSQEPNPRFACWFLEIGSWKLVLGDWFLEIGSWRFFMLEVVKARLRQGHRTSLYPQIEPTLPERFRGLPVLDQSKCPPGCQVCAEACPTDAITVDEFGLKLDLGRCLFCT